MIAWRRASQLDNEVDGARAHDAEVAAVVAAAVATVVAGAEQAAKRRDDRSATLAKGKSRYFGLTWDAIAMKWTVQITVEGKNTIIGHYDEETAAAWAYDAYVIPQKIDKTLNFPSAPGAAGHTSTRKRGSSRHTGVSWHKSARKWVATIKLDAKPKHLGCFVDEDAAGRAYDAAVRTHYRGAKPKRWKGYNFALADGDDASPLDYRNTIDADPKFSTPPERRKRKSPHRGVSWNKSARKWVATIKLVTKAKYLGCFVDDAMAARAYDAAIRKYYPNTQPRGWKRFNFPAKGEAGHGENKDDVCISSDEEEEERLRRRRRCRETRTEAEVLVGNETLWSILSTAYAPGTASRSADVDCAANAEVDLDCFVNVVEAGEEPRPKRQRVAFSIMTACEVDCAANAEVDFKAKPLVVEAGEEPGPKRQRVAFPVMTASL